MIYLFSHTPIDDKNILHVKLGEINFLQFDIPDISIYDALIFTSKNGVKALTKRVPQWKNIPACVIGEATKKMVENFGGKVCFCATSSYGDRFAKEVASLLKAKRVLFVRAKEVASNIRELLVKEGLHIDELIAYESFCVKQEKFVKPQKNSVLIFTSPSMVKCFIKHFKFEDSWKIICIGKSTAHQLPQNVSYCIPKKQTLQACVELVK